MLTTRTSEYLLLEAWEAVPLAAPLRKVGEATKIKRPWSPACVPGHWQLEEAFAAYEGHVLYRCRFEGRTPHIAGMVSLRFGGVYYSARVWLNGIFLGAHEGYFAPFEFDCTEAVVEGENELLVEVFSPEETDENDRRTIGGVWARWDGMNPHVNPGGIFRDVALLYGGEVRIRSLGAQVEPSGHGRVFVDLYANQEAQVKLMGLVRPLGFEAPGAKFEEDVWIEPGCGRVEVGFFLPRPRLWWTWDRGEQPLYELIYRCSGEERRVRFGVRSVELRDWKVYLNGERVFPRGINYVPTDAYPARASEERLRADADLVRGANLNAVRVHAHVAEEGFYRACDELGVLVFQDFPLQWTHRRRVLASAAQQAREMVRGLRNHPCVGVYLAHNEPFYVIPPEKWTILGLGRTTVESLAPRWSLWQRRVLGPAVVSVLVEEDPSRPVIEAAGHPRTTNHLYFGWYYGRFRDLERVVKFLPGIVRLPTEYGVQALPDAETLKEIWREGQEEPDWDALSRSYRFQAVRMRRYVPWRGERTAYVQESQAYQARALKYVTELLRRRKYRPTGGAFAFMLNDPAPAITWSVVDWRRRRKAAYEVLAAAMSPVLVCAQYPRDSYRVGGIISLYIFVVNDFMRGLERVRWSWELSIEGTGIAQDSGEVGISPDSVVRVGQIRGRLPIPGRARLQLRLYGEGVEASNAYDFLVKDGYRPLRGLLALEQ